MWLLNFVPISQNTTYQQGLYQLLHPSFSVAPSPTVPLFFFGTVPILLTDRQVEDRKKVIFVRTPLRRLVDDGDVALKNKMLGFRNEFSLKLRHDTWFWFETRNYSTLFHFCIAWMYKYNFVLLLFSFFVFWTLLSLAFLQQLFILILIEIEWSDGVEPTFFR